MPAKAPTLVRVYKGKQQADAIKSMQRDAASLAYQGYFPTSQSWAAGQWGCGAFLVALILFVVLIGILVFIYMLLVKPAGTLTVTYVLREVTQPSSQPMSSSGPAAAAPPAAPLIAAKPDPIAALNSLAAMRERGLISPEDYEAKKAELLRRV